MGPQVPYAVLIVLAGVLGLVFGSFVTALSYRLPRKISIMHGRSACPACGSVLQARDLVPLFSWLLSRGACRRCGASIPWRYPAIEATTALLFVAAFLSLGLGPKLFFVLAATPIMVALGVIDIEHQRLPNLLLGLLAVLTGAMRWALGGDAGAATVTAGIVLALCLLLNWAGQRLDGQGLGSGDVKLMAIVAFALPIPLLFSVLGVAGLLGVILAGVRRFGAKIAGPFPFGPPILFSFWLGLLYSWW